MTTPIQITEKVSAQRLDTMYGNFVKLTDWVLKGTESKHTMPEPFRALFDSAALAQVQQAKIAELSNLVGTLQQRANDHESRLVAMQCMVDKINVTLTNLNTTLDKLVVVFDAVNTQRAAAAEAQPVEAQPVEAQPVEAQPVLDEELADLDAPPQPEVAANEHVVQVSAAAVGAGSLDPASFEALDREIASLVG